MKKIIIILLSIMIPLVFFVISITVLTQVKIFYSYEFEKLNTIEKANIEGVSSEEMAQMMVSFIRGEKDTFQLVARVNGIERDLFNNKEQLHMNDVRHLVHLGNWISLISIFIIFMLYFILYLKEGRKLRFVYKLTVGVYLFFLAGLLLISLMDFNIGFNFFHEILFTNDLWILNPNKDILLMLMPLQFFMDALKIAVLGISIAMILLGVITWRITKKENMYS